MSSDDESFLARSFTRRQAAFFGAACATRVGPAFTAFAGAASSRAFGDWLGALWSLAAAPDDDQTRALSARILAAPESGVGDSNKPEYYAMRALGVLVYAVQIMTGRDVQAATSWCSQSAVSLLRDFDFVLSSEPSAAASLAGMESAEQAATARRMAELGETISARDEMTRCLESDVYLRLPAVIDDVARLRGWRLSAGPGRPR